MDKLSNFEDVILRLKSNSFEKKFDGNYIELRVTYEETDTALVILYNTSTDFLYIRDWLTNEYFIFYHASKLVNEDFHFQQYSKKYIHYSSEEMAELMSYIL
jgi:hypothetical protein